MISCFSFVLLQLSQIDVYYAPVPNISRSVSIVGRHGIFDESLIPDLI